jgi:hypothetical protein
MFFLSHLGGCEGWADRCDERVGEKTKTRFRDKGAGGSHSRWTKGLWERMAEVRLMHKWETGLGWHMVRELVSAMIEELVTEREGQERHKWTRSNCRHAKCTKLCWS